MITVVNGDRMCYLVLSRAHGCSIKNIDKVMVVDGQARSNAVVMGCGFAIKMPSSLMQGRLRLRSDSVETTNSGA